jgi:hypothetical protein
MSVLTRATRRNNPEDTILNIDVLLFFSGIWIVTHFHMICTQFLCNDFYLHSSDEPAMCVYFSIHLYLDQPLCVIFQ